MNVISITPTTNTRVIGRLSDGSDRQTITETLYVVTVQDGGLTYSASFETEPTMEEINQAYADGVFRDVTTESEKIEQLNQQYSDLSAINVALTARLSSAEQAAADNSLAQQELLELLIEMGVI